MTASTQSPTAPAKVSNNSFTMARARFITSGDAGRYFAPCSIHFFTNSICLG